MSVGNIIFAGNCHQCGRLTLPRELQLNGETIASFYGCPSCVDKTIHTLARVKPIFQTMITQDIPRDIANDVMTYLLEKLDEKNNSEIKKDSL